MNGKGQALSLPELLEPNPAPNHPGWGPGRGRRGAPRHPLPRPSRYGALTPWRHAWLGLPSATSPSGGVGGLSLVRAPRRLARCRKTNLSHSAVSAGCAPPGPARAREPLFNSFCHNFLLPHPSAPAASRALPPAGWRLPRCRPGLAPQ
jgi:hypothetical protein